jgi:hypothetical protein
MRPIVGARGPRGQRTRSESVPASTIPGVDVERRGIAISKALVATGPGRSLRAGEDDTQSQQGQSHRGGEDGHAKQTPSSGTPPSRPCTPDPSTGPSRTGPSPSVIAAPITLFQYISRPIGISPWAWDPRRGCSPTCLDQTPEEVELPGRRGALDSTRRARHPAPHPAQVRSG